MRKLLFIIIIGTLFYVLYKTGFFDTGIRLIKDFAHEARHDIVRVKNERDNAFDTYRKRYNILKSK